MYIYLSCWLSLVIQMYFTLSYVSSRPKSAQKTSFFPKLPANSKMASTTTIHPVKLPSLKGDQMEAVIMYNHSIIHFAVILIFRMLYFTAFAEISFQKNGAYRIGHNYPSKEFQSKSAVTNFEPTAISILTSASCHLIDFLIVQDVVKVLYFGEFCGVSLAAQRSPRWQKLLLLIRLFS